MNGAFFDLQLSLSVSICKSLCLAADRKLTKKQIVNISVLSHVISYVIMVAVCGCRAYCCAASVHYNNCS